MFGPGNSWWWPAQQSSNQFSKHKSSQIGVSNHKIVCKTKNSTIMKSSLLHILYVVKYWRVKYWQFVVKSPKFECHRGDSEKYYYYRQKFGKHNIFYPSNISPCMIVWQLIPVVKIKSCMFPQSVKCHFVTID